MFMLPAGRANKRPGPTLPLPRHLKLDRRHPAEKEWGKKKKGREDRGRGHSAALSLRRSREQRMPVKKGGGEGKEREGSFIARGPSGKGSPPCAEERGGRDQEAIFFFLLLFLSVLRPRLLPSPLFCRFRWGDHTARAGVRPRRGGRDGRTFSYREKVRKRIRPFSH